VYLHLIQNSWTIIDSRSDSYNWLTNNSDASLLQSLVFGFLWDLNIWPTLLLDLLYVVATLSNNHSCCAVRDQNLNLHKRSSCISSLISCQFCIWLTSSKHYAKISAYWHFFNQYNISLKWVRCIMIYLHKFV